MPRGNRKRLPGHALVRREDGVLGCECGWMGSGSGWWQRSKHIADVRMDLAENR